MKCHICIPYDVLYLQPLNNVKKDCLNLSKTVFSR
jgi:hypothetical protein